MPRSHTARRAWLAAQRRAGGELRRPAASRARSAWPSKITVAELDELAARHGVTFAEGATKADKQTALEAAGVGPEG